MKCFANVGRLRRNLGKLKNVGEPYKMGNELVRQHILAELTVPRTDAGKTKCREEAFAPTGVS